MNVTEDELRERVFDSLNDLLASVEGFYNEAGVEFMDEYDRIAVLKARWLVALMNKDEEYLADHTWEAALQPEP